MRGGLDELRGLVRLVGGEVGAVGESARVHGDQADPVAEHVVHLARDPGALVELSLLDAQGLLGLGTFGAVTQGPHQLATRADVHAARRPSRWRTGARGCSRSTPGPLAEPGWSRGTVADETTLSRRMTTTCQITLRVARDTVASVPGTVGGHRDRAEDAGGRRDREGPASAEEGQPQRHEPEGQVEPEQPPAPAATARAPTWTTDAAERDRQRSCATAVPARSVAGCTAPGSDVALCSHYESATPRSRSLSLDRPLLWSRLRDP